MGFDPAEVAGISSALISAIGEAKVMADAGQFGTELAELWQHIRELHELLVESVAEAGDVLPAQLRVMVDDMGERVNALGALIRESQH